jgi:hypothetical protein
VTDLAAAASTLGAATRLRQYRIALPAGMKLLNANQRLHHRAKAPLTKDIREAARLMARQAKIPHLERAHVFYVVHPVSTARLRDPGNWAPSAKAAVDGMVDAGVLEDDNSTRLLGPDPRLGTPVKHGQLVLVITDLGDFPADFLGLFDPTRQIVAPRGAR